jgi:hypothetical protein
MQKQTWHVRVYEDGMNETCQFNKWMSLHLISQKSAKS